MHQSGGDEAQTTSHGQATGHATLGKRSGRVGFRVGGHDPGKQEQPDPTEKEYLPNPVKELIQQL
jgi:hypothetical protein